MPVLLIVGGGLFGSLAATYARSKGLEVHVFNAHREGAASPAAAGLFKEAWAGRRFAEHYRRGLTLLDRFHSVQSISLRRDDGGTEALLFVSPTAILERTPLREEVTAVGDGWLEAGGVRHAGWVYVAAGVWCSQFFPELTIQGKAGAAFRFAGESEGRFHPFAPSRQAIAFVRDPGSTHFSDGTAEVEYTAEHDRLSLDRAAELGLSGTPIERLWGRRPYTAGGPVFRQMGSRTWVATGGRKLGTLLGASLARRLVEEELR